MPIKKPTSEGNEDDEENLEPGRVAPVGRHSDHPSMDLSLSNIKNSSINISGGDIQNSTFNNLNDERKIEESIQNELYRQRSMMRSGNTSVQKDIAGNRRLSIFLCHSSGDKLPVWKLFRQLQAEKWVDPWLDSEKLLPGEDWDLEIKKALRASDVIIVCLSNDSVNKEGYVQKEIAIALDFAQEKPEDAIFVVPLKLEECIVPYRLSKWQWVNFFEENAYERLLMALKRRAKKLGIDEKSQ